MPIHQSTPTRKSRPTVKGRPHLNVVNVNCQSASAKRLSLERLISHQRPDIVIGTESWLHAGIENQTIFPTDVYQVFSRDREKGNTMGGVFILATKKELTITREVELETDCELLWCRVEVKAFTLLPTINQMKKMNPVLMSSRNRYIDWGNVTMVS